MSLFDSILKNTSQIGNSLVGNATSYVVSNAVTKVQEATNKIADTLGVDLPFAKIGASLPTASSLAASAIQEGMRRVEMGPFLQQQVDKILDANDLIVSASDVNQYSDTSETSGIDNYQVYLASDSEKVVFDVLPQISEQRTVGYEEVQPAQSPAPFQKYKGTGATVYTVNAMLIARTADEATKNLNYMLLLRTWTKPFFGNRTAEVYTTSLGAPPPALTFAGLRGYIVGPTPVVIQSLTWDWPRDVDWIATNISAQEGGGMVPFPTVMNVSISLYESYSPAQINQFSLADFRAGRLDTAYGSVSADQQEPR